MKIILSLFVLCAVLAAEGSGVTVFRQGRDVWIQSRYSRTQDIIIQIWLGVNERSFLVPRNSDIRQWKKGILHHSGGDEYPATAIGHYGYLGGNHGSAYGRLVTAKDHGFTAKDCGKIITDEKKLTYMITGVLDKNRFYMHPLSRRPKAPIGRPYFFYHSKNRLFYKGKEIKFTSSRLAQLRPLNIVTRNEYLIDGKTPLPEGKVVKCRSLLHIFEHGVLAPEAVLQYIQKYPGERTAALLTHRTKMIYPEEFARYGKEYIDLPRLMTARNRMSYQANGAMVNEKTTHFPVSLSSVNQLDVMFGQGGNITRNAKYYRYYIPKTRPVAIPRLRSKTEKYQCDFIKGYDVPRIFDVSYVLKKSDVPDPQNQPDRFIRITGKNSPEHGIVLGYSLTEGVTSLAEKNKLRPESYFFYRSKKMYPYAYALRNNKPGTTVTSVSYKQYFCPANDPDAIAFYFHRQRNSDYVYYETRKTLRNKVLALPAYFTGKKITVVEKSKSVTLHTPGRVPASGVRISSRGNNGYIVLKLD